MTLRSALLFIVFLATGVPVYADGGTQITACVAALPSKGGVCDFRNRGAIAAASSIVVSKPVTLLLRGTQLTLDGTPGIVIQADDVRIEGVSGETELIQGGALGSREVNRNVIYGNELRGLEIRGVTFEGIPCSMPEDNNNGIKLQNAAPGSISRVWIADNVFTGFCDEAMLIQNAADVDVTRNTIYSVSDGIRFSGVDRGQIVNNVIRDSQLPNNGEFTVAIGLDTNATLDDKVSYPDCADVRISGNKVSGYVNGEGVMVHGGSAIVISDNAFDNVLLGIGVDPLSPTDLVFDVTVAGNSYVGTTTSGASATTGNYGIFVGGGQETERPMRVDVRNNTIRQANEIAQSLGEGGIGVGYSSDVLIEDNVVSNSLYNGISMINPNDNLVIRGNRISNITGANANGVHGWLGVQTGSIYFNAVDSATCGYRFDVHSPELLFGRNDATNVSVAVTGASNVGVE